MRKATRDEVEDADGKLLEALREKTRFSRADVTTAMRLGRILGDPPPASGTDDEGKPYWRKDEFAEWAKRQRLVRSAAAAEILHRTMPLAPGSGAPSSWNETARTGRAVIATETPVLRMDWNTGNPVMEVLLATGGRIPRQLPFQVDHSFASAANIGSWHSPVLRGREWEADFQIGRGEFEDSMANKIGSGHIRGVSIGYRVDAFVYIAPGESRAFAGHTLRNTYEINMLVATEWSVHECSLTPVPADSSALIRSTQGTTQMSVGMQPRNSARTMDEVLQRDRVVVTRDRSSAMFNYYGRLEWEQLQRTALWSTFSQQAEVSVGVGYDGAEDVTRGWVEVVDVANYKTIPLGRLADARLKYHPRGATAEQTEMEVNASNVRVHRFSRMTGVTEEEIVNAKSLIGSDFVKRAVLAQFGRAAADVKSDMVFSTLLSNPEMPDGEDLFSAAHANDFSCTLAELDETLSEVAAAMAAQTNGESAIGLRPDFFISSSALERPLRKQIREIDLFSGDHTPTPSVRSSARIDAGVIDPITETKVAGSASTIFVASGVEGYGLVAAFLEGSNRRPSISSWTEGNGRFGIGYAVKLDVGVAIADYKGLARIVITEE